jgi:hypothetical protein
LFYGFYINTFNKSWRKIILLESNERMLDVNHINYIAGKSNFLIKSKNRRFSWRPVKVFLGKQAPRLWKKVRGNLYHLILRDGNTRLHDNYVLICRVENRSIWLDAVKTSPTTRLTKYTIHLLLHYFMLMKNNFL